MSKIDRYLKCDLHLHSSSCYSRDFIYSEFKAKLDSCDLDVVSITDHNVIDVEMYKDLKQNLRNKKIIGGMELNLAIDEETIKSYNLKTQGDYFHAVIWFSFNDIEKVWKIQQELIKDLGIDLSGLELKQISKKTEGKVFFLKKVQEKYKNINYFLTFHESKSERNLSGYLKNGIKENEKFKHNLFYYNNKLAVEGGRKSKIISNFFEESLDVLVSRFYFSDPKSLDEIGSKFTWILFDGEFEDLILPMSDPTSRIFTSDEYSAYPQLNNDRYLEAIKLIMKLKDSTQREFKLTFSPGLNGIIGSRGSGKSLLGAVLADEDVNSKYSDYIDHGKTQYKLHNGEYEFSKPKCKYLKQDGLLEIFRNGQLKDIAFLKDFYIKQEVYKKAKIDNFISKAQKLLVHEKNLLNNLIENYQNDLLDLNFIENEVNLDYIIPNFDRDECQDNIELIDKSKNALDQINVLINQIIQLSNSLEPSIDEYSEMRDYNSSLERYKKEFKDISVKMYSINYAFVELITNYKLDRNIQLRGMNLDTYLSILNKFNKQFSIETSNYITKKENAMNQLIDFYKFRLTVNSIKNRITQLLTDVKAETKSDPLKINEKDIIEISTTIEDINDFKRYLEEEFKNYDCDKHDDHLLKIYFDYKDTSAIKSNFNGNKYKNIMISKGIIDKYYNNIVISLQNINNFKIKLYFNDKDLDKYSPGKKSEILLDLFLEKYILNQDYMFVVLDQPEDNMDTMTITRKLIKRIRELKKEIQLFVISHSAAVIINGDAENIIYAYDDENTLNYQQGRIIDNFMKENIVDTLDGGEKNLKMRFNKYDFKLMED